MEVMKRSSLKYFVIVFLASVSTLLAQPAPPGSNNPAPIGGVALLALAGAAYGAKKIYDQKNSDDLH
jgi:hypothetical protein